MSEKVEHTELKLPLAVREGYYDSSPEACQFPQGPEILEAGGETLAYLPLYQEASAYKIVLACNSYPALLAERDRFREALEKIEKYPRPNNSTGRHARFYDGVNVAIDRISAIARAALKDTNQ